MPRALELRFVLLLAAAVRVLWALAVPVEPVSDSHAYDVLSQNLAAGLGFGWEPGKPTAYWSVGPALIYALSFRVFGHSYVPIVVAQIAVGVLSVWLVVRLGEHWFDPTTGRVAGLFLALWPSQVQFSTVLASELWFSPLLLGACLLWFARPLPYVWRGIFAGVALGVGCYFRPTALLLPVVFAALDLLARRPWREALFGAALALALVMAIAEPWTARNTRAFGMRVGLTSNLGLNFWQGNNPDTSGWYMPRPDSPELAGLNEAEVSRHLGALALDHVRERPLAFVGRTLWKIAKQHSRETIGVVWNAQGLQRRYPLWVYDGLRAESALYWIAMLVLALGGFLWLARRRGALAALTHPCVVVCGYFAAVHGVIVIQDRYSFQSVPFIAMLAALLVAGLALDQVREGGPSRARRGIEPVERPHRAGEQARADTPR